jgi:hypothetical protein
VLSSPEIKHAYHRSATRFALGTTAYVTPSAKGAHFTSNVVISGRMIACGIYFLCDSLS